MKATDKVRIFIDKFASRIVPIKAPIPPPKAKGNSKKRWKYSFPKLIKLAYIR
jgi:hypothetical protein